MKCKSLFILAIVLQFQSHVFAQTDSNLETWSNWIPTLDRNQNKVKISVLFVGHLFQFKLINKYDEPVSGRLLINYIGRDGFEDQINCKVYCLQPDEVFDNFIKTSEKDVAKIIDIKFVEFSSCSMRSKLLAYTAKDSLIFSIYNEIKKEEAQKQNLLASSNENDKKNILIDNSDGTILYQGANESSIKALLSKVKGWKTNSGLQIQDGFPPQVIVSSDCQRDAYVNSAVLYSWAAESYYRIKEPEKAKVAANKVGELLQLAQQLCNDGQINFQNGSCKTVDIFACGSSNSLNLSNNASGNSVQSQPVKSGVQNSSAATAGNKPTESKKENELFAGLLPVVAAFGTNSLDAQANSLSGFADKLATYAENDSMSDGFLKVMTRLAALNVKMQAMEITNNQIPTSVNNQMGSSINSTGMGLSSITTTDFSQMNSFQQMELAKSIVYPLAELLTAKVNANGLTDAEQKRRDKLEETIKLRNREYREKYGYTVRQFTDAIRHFDDELLDKILATEFPIDTKVMHDIKGFTISGGTDYWLTGLHYAAEVGNDYAVKKFLQKGMNINEKAYGFFSGLFPKGLECRPINLAVYNDQYTTVKLLLENGASTKEKCNYPSYSKNPLHAAKELKYYDLIKLLETHSNKK